MGLWILRKLDELASQALSMLLLSVGVALVVAAWAALRYFEPPVAVLLGLGSLTALVTLVNQTHQYFGRLKIPRTDEDVRRQLLEWASQANIVIKPQSPRTNESIRLTLIDDAGRTVDVIKIRSLSTLRFGVHLELDTGLMSKYSMLGAAQRLETTLAVRSELVRSAMLFEANDPLQRVLFGEDVAVDQMVEAEQFYKQFRKMTGLHLLITQIVLTRVDPEGAAVSIEQTLAIN